ncbi:hypothetical protein ABTF54_20535, partial [Acinetobacter baumannii]
SSPVSPIIPPVPSAAGPQAVSVNPAERVSILRDTIGRQAPADRSRRLAIFRQRLRGAHGLAKAAATFSSALG